jgi:hypothetical protein
MTTFEKIELSLIPLAGLALYLFAPALPLLFPAQLGVGRLLTLISALLLFQGLVRDLFLLAKQKRMVRSQPAMQQQPLRSMCLESTLGVMGLLLGAGLIGLGWYNDPPLMLPDWAWGCLLMLVMSVGFVIKDLVIDSRPWRIRRDKDHMNILFKWRQE